MAKVGRKQKLTPEQVDALRRRYANYWWNQPKRLRLDFGIGQETLRRYVRDLHKGGS